MRCGTPPPPARPHPTPRADELVAGAAAVLERVRTRAPRVHCITNAVAQNISANMLLALGAVPSMTIAPDEVGEFAARADALLVNLGTFDAERRAAAEIAIGSIAQANRPWVLDPVFIERSQPRTAFARTLASRHPSALRLNRAEFAALAGAPWSEGGLRAYAFEADAVLGTDGRNRPRHRRSTARAHRQWASADGQGHRHGVLGVARLSRPALRSKPTRGLRPRPR